jgi:UDP-glucose 4-epimerase
MNIFLTGGAGYIGSVATRALLDADHTVTVFDSLVTGYRAAIPGEVRFVEGDLGDQFALTEVFKSERYDAVMHFAGFIEAGESMNNPGKYFKNNFSNSLTLIEAAVDADVGQFVFSSSAAVYASSDDPLTEGSALGPANVYGQTKLMIEETLEWYRKVHGVHYAALRYFNASGAIEGCGEAHHPESHLIPLVLQVPLGKRNDVKIYGTDYPTPDGTCIRDYIHVSDLISAHLLALEKLVNEERLVYNLGNGTGYSVREVIDTAREVTGHPVAAEETPRRPGDAPRLVASSEKIQRELGWAPQIPNLSEIIHSAWDWHRSHPEGYS